MEVRYIEIKTSPEGQTIKAYTPAQYKKEMTRRKNAAARARKLNRLQERVGAALALMGFLVLLGAGGMCEIGQIIGYGLAGLFLIYPLWGWRRLDLASRYMVAELRELRSEPTVLPRQTGLIANSSTLPWP